VSPRRWPAVYLLSEVRADMKSSTSKTNP